MKFPTLRLLAVLSLMAASSGYALAAPPAVPPAAAAPARQQVTPVYYRIVLENAMFYMPKPPKTEPDELRELVMDLEQTGDSWGAIYCISRRYNQNFHKGAVKEAKISGDKITLKIGTEIGPDKWIPGGQGDYTVTLTRNADGTVKGSFTGTYNGLKASGNAFGTAYAPARDPKFVPLAPQEHPRLLFRKSDLPALKAKFATPFGQAARAKLESSGMPASMGLLYQLTGDKTWAEKAQKEAEEYLAGRKPGGDPFVPKKPLWAQLEQLALVYDLCYDVLPEDFKARYRSWLADLAYQVYFAPETLGNTNWHVVSNHVANVYSGMTLGALACFDEPAPAPEPPAPPFLEETLPPMPADWKPAPGVPVVTMEPAKSPTSWIHTEMLRKTTPDDPRDVFYGLEKIHPDLGKKVKIGDFELTFDAQPETMKSDAPIGGLKVGHLIDAAATAKAKEPLTMVAYTVLEVKEPGTYTLYNPNSRANLAQAAIAGKLIANGQVIKLEKGLYPLMQMVQWRMKWGEIAPHFRPSTETEVKEWNEKTKPGLAAKYETKKSTFATAKSAGGNPGLIRLYRLARFTSSLHCEHAVGKGGFQGEVGGYSVDASSGHAKLWPVYSRVMGFDLTPDHEYPDVLPRKIVGGPQDINGTTHIGDEYWAALYPTVKDEWKPEILQAWNNEFKVTGPETAANVLKQDTIGAFLYYPLDGKTAPIGTKLPLTWDAPGFGYYVIRSGWDKDAFIAQVFLKSMRVSGWSGESAGTYRLRGLGQNWAVGTDDRVRQRQQENVVWLPESDLSEGERGKLTHLAFGEKTMSVSVDLSEIYERKGRFWFTAYGHLKMPSLPTKDTPQIPESSGITGMRALAFDYSGLSGAPCLFATVDKIDGGEKEKRIWLFQPALSAGNAGGKNTAALSAALGKVVSAIDGGFVVKPGANASLRGVFAHPADVKVGTTGLTYSYIKNFGKGQGEKINVAINAVTVPGTDHFFFVGTVADKDHPEVKIQGSGLDATVTVGKRTVKFDGKKIVLGQQ